MNTASPVPATLEDLKRVVQLGRSPRWFLSIYLPTDPSGVTTGGTRLRLAALLDQLAANFTETPWEAPFREERIAVERYIRSLRPGGRGLAILSSLEGSEWEALWLPEAVAEHVRFGRGAYVLPLLDVLDEWEPVGVAVVARDKARLMVLAAGRIEEAHNLEAEAPEADQTRGRLAPRYQRPGVTREAGGGGAAGFQRHLQEHVNNHFKRVARELDNLYRRHSFGRLLLAGPSETVAQFKPHLSRELADRLVGELSVEARSSDREICDQVVARVRDVERKEEQELVEEVVTRAEKDQGAVVELAPTLWALNRHQLHLLALAGDTSEAGGYCPNCELLLPPEDINCTQCGGTTLKVDLWEELPAVALRRNIKVEVVHGAAASLLWQYEGIGGLLEPVRR